MLQGAEGRGPGQAGGDRGRAGAGRATVRRAEPEAAGTDRGREEGGWGLRGDGGDGGGHTCTHMHPPRARTHAASLTTDHARAGGPYREGSGRAAGIEDAVGGLGAPMGAHPGREEGGRSETTQKGRRPPWLWSPEKLEIRPLGVSGGHGGCTPVTGRGGGVRDIGCSGQHGSRAESEPAQPPGSLAKTCPWKPVEEARLQARAGGGGP